MFVVCVCMCACVHVCVCVCVHMRAGPLHLLFPLLEISPRFVHVYPDASLRSLFKYHLFPVLFYAGKDLLV